jgi:signal transduction histidine kinase
MKELEITDLPPLKPTERSLLNQHSLLNIFNVLRGELTLIGLEVAGDDALLRAALHTCDRLIRGLRDPELAIADARALEQHIAAIMRDVSATLAEHPDKQDNAEIRESLANLDSVFAILRTRARELLARAEHPEQWAEFNVADLYRDFMGAFAAIEKNSHGRYRILYNAALQEAPDYYVDFKIESVDAPSLWMPAVFQDVMRDLIANARKYTAPGGRITAALHAGHDALRFCVEDTGRGIPGNEIAHVVEFGHRASNVADVRTMGGGFGLTKAFFVTKQFNGRFWIGSQLGAGTRIRILLPRPAPTAERTVSGSKTAHTVAPAAV